MKSHYFNENQFYILFGKRARVKKKKKDSSQNSRDNYLTLIIRTIITAD